MYTSAEGGRSDIIDTNIAVSRKRALDGTNVVFKPTNRNNLPAFKLARIVSNPQNATIIITNKFSVLNEELLNDESVQQAPRTTSRGERQKKEKEIKKIKTPDVRPIMAKLGNEERKILKKLATEDQCYFTVASAREFTRIFPKTPDAYIAISKLDEYEVQHILFPERATNDDLKVVIRGLPHGHLPRRN